MASSDSARKGHVKYVPMIASRASVPAATSTDFGIVDGAKPPMTSCLPPCSSTHDQGGVYPVTRGTVVRPEQAQRQLPDFCAAMGGEDPASPSAWARPT
jgi:hypothetical protein